MPRRAVEMLVVAVLLLFVAGALWGEYGKGTESSRPEATARPGTEMMGKPEMGMMPSYGREFDRCTMTCGLLMGNYQKMYAMMKAHEGDRRCWSTCWSRFGEGKSDGVAQEKALWMKHRPERMHANQCAQACWRVHHDESKEVMVGGWRSAPRDAVCAP